MRIALSFLGCKVNSCEIEEIKELLINSGHEVVPYSEIADVYVFNTCTVTSMADSKSRQMLRRPKLNNSQAIVIAIGCMAERILKSNDILPGVDYLLGQVKGRELVDFIHGLQLTKKVLKERRQFISGELPKNGKEKVRFFLKIQDGCDSNCAYCIIPSVRGKSRSVPISQSLEDIRIAASEGLKEVILAGIHLGLYGKDLGNVDTIPRLVAEIGKIKGISRIRLGSIEPSDFTDEMMSMLQDQAKVCPYLHIPLQTGSDILLQGMFRTYSVSDYTRLIQQVKFCRKDISIGTDIIVGLPGETDEDFSSTLELLEEIGFSRIHAFPYSDRPGTVASTMPNKVSDVEKKERMRTVLELADTLKRKHLTSQVGKTTNVLIESVHEDIHGVYYFGYSDDYTEVRVYNVIDMQINQIIQVRISSTGINYLVGNPS